MDQITKARVLELIAAYGADVNAFPEEERAAAAACIEAAPGEFDDVLAEARVLDAAFGELPGVSPGEALVGRIVAAAPAGRAEAKRPLRALWQVFLPDGQRWPFAAGLASLAIGAVMGFNLAANELPSGESYDDGVIYAALGLIDPLGNEEAYP